MSDAFFTRTTLYMRVEFTLSSCPTNHKLAQICSYGNKLGELVRETARKRISYAVRESKAHFSRVAVIFDRFRSSWKWNNWNVILSLRRGIFFTLRSPHSSVREICSESDGSDMLDLTYSWIFETVAELYLRVSNHLRIAVITATLSINI